MRYIVTFLTTVLLLGSALYGLILAVDPYNKFGYNLFSFETKAVDFARENKFNQVEHATKKYELFLMGSSSAHRYWTKELTRLSGLESYNYSIQSATPEDFIAMTRHILKKGFPVKLIMISVDFEAMSRATKTDDMFYSSPLKNFLKEVPAEELEADFFNNTYLTLGALGDSFKVIWVNLFGKANHAYLDDGDHIVEPLPRTLKVSQFGYKNFEVDSKRVQYLKTIVELGKKHGFKVMAFTSPLSQEHMDRINKDPKIKASHEKFKHALVSIFGEIHDFQNDGNRPFNSVEYFRDSNHPTHEFSTIILERIFGKEFPDNPEFGKILR